MNHPFEQWKQSKDDAFTEQFSPYLSMMRRQCRRLAGNVWDGDDLFQHALIKSFKAWQANPSRPMTKAYLYRIISNAWIDDYRKMRLPEFVQESFDDMAARTDVPQAKERLSAAMKIILEKLNRNQILVYLMHEGWGLSAAAIGKRCGITAGNVRVILHRAKKRLTSAQREFVSGRMLSDRDLARWLTAFQSGDPERMLTLFQNDRLQSKTYSSCGSRGITCQLAA
ncbi:RNA polymerase sigma factor [Sporolactobacillus terrae]|uniref:RNA polymerase sigma factor n=1 Tax=Sporolactobacillus terrae TaxID=269673 RepID=UPI00048A77CF|nr:sigma-70 family RNA polymerase sigma factor [Sporolactobacillus terrae]